MTQIYKLDGINTEFLNVLGELGVVIETDKPKPKLSATDFQNAGLNPMLLQGMQDFNDARLQVLSQSEQKRFVDFYRAVTDGFDGDQKTQEFLRLTSQKPGGWLTSDFMSLISQNQTPSALAELSEDLIRTCISTHGLPTANEKSVQIITNSEHNDLLSFLAPVMGAVTDPITYSTCPVDPARPDLQENLAVNVLLLPRNLYHASEFVFIAIAVRNTDPQSNDFALGNVIYLGGGKFVTARHVFYPDNGTESIVALSITNGPSYNPEEARTILLQQLNILQDDSDRDLLMFEAPNLINDGESLSLNFAALPEDPQSWVGKTVIHVGSPSSDFVQNQMSGAIEKVATYGRILSVDAETGSIVTDNPSAPGSSGGVLMLEDGTIIGVSSQSGVQILTHGQGPDGFQHYSVEHGSQTSVFSAFPADWLPSK